MAVASFAVASKAKMSGLNLMAVQSAFLSFSEVELYCFTVCCNNEQKRLCFRERERDGQHGAENGSMRTTREERGVFGSVAFCWIVSTSRDLENWHFLLVVGLTS